MIRTYRVVDGGRVDGEALLVLARVAGDFRLLRLSVYADGVIDSGTSPLPWSFEDFVDAVRRGELVTEMPDGVSVDCHEVGTWTMTEARSSRGEAELLAEVADILDRLNGRPTITHRWFDAMRAYGRQPSEERLAELRTADDAIPDNWGWLVDSAATDAAWKILHGVGQPWFGIPLTQEQIDEATATLVEYAREFDAAAYEPKATGVAGASTIELRDLNFAHPEPIPDYPNALRNEYPAPLTVEGRTYASLHHAFYALSTLDEAGRDAIAAEKLGYRVPYIAEDYPERDGWDGIRVAVMTELLRGKFRRYPELAEMLVSTGGARLVYQSRDEFWGERAGGSPHWMGRLLEMVRSELVAARGGIVLDVR